MRILFVCTGNICRSPFCEHLTRRLVQQAGWLDVDVASAGTHALQERGCPREAIKAAKAFDLDLSTHRAVQVDAEALREADLVLVMSPEQTYMLQAIHPDLAEARVRVLADFAPGPSRPPYVPDPFGSELWAYQASYRFIDACIREFLDDLRRHRSH